MPLVLYSGGGPSRDGYDYDDRTGVSYEFPDRYLSKVVEGERFVYHEPRVYSGTGVIGSIVRSAFPGRNICEILDWQPFPTKLCLKDAAGEYFEIDRDAGQEAVYWAQGVRLISEPSFDRIVRAAGSVVPLDGRQRESQPHYPARSAIEQYAVDVVLRLLSTEHAGVEIDELPPNNPGYDIRVGPPANPARYVNVRATRSAEPVFWLTEGERQFSVVNSERFELFVIAGIDPNGTATTHRVYRHAGAVQSQSVLLEPSQWRGKLTS